MGWWGNTAWHIHWHTFLAFGAGKVGVAAITFRLRPSISASSRVATRGQTHGPCPPTSFTAPMHMIARPAGCSLQSQVDATAIYFEITQAANEIVSKACWPHLGWGTGHSHLFWQPPYVHVSIQVQEGVSKMLSEIPNLSLFSEKNIVRMRKI